MRKLIVICMAVLVLLIVNVGGSYGSDLHTCTVCKKQITGNKFVLADGQYYHPKHFRCANCNAQITTSGYFEREHKIYDSTCYIELFSPRCVHCGKPMPSDYVEVQGKKYHEYCYGTKIALRCDLCSRIIEGPYLVDYFGNKVHKSHKGKASQCEYCGRFISQAISKGSTIYSDGREVCGYCSPSTVNSYQEAQALMAAVRDTLEKEGIKVSLKSLVLYPVDKIRMQDFKPPRGTEAQAFTYFAQSRRLYGLLSTQDFRIYVLDRLPRIEFIATIAHELMHVWLGQNADFEMNQTLAEGGCNYAAFLALRHFGQNAQYVIDKMAKDEDPVYGEGFRKTALYAEQVGTQNWLKRLRKHSVPPWDETASQ